MYLPPRCEFPSLDVCTAKSESQTQLDEIESLRHRVHELSKSEAEVAKMKKKVQDFDDLKQHVKVQRELLSVVREGIGDGR